jgi:hypothetical protein
VSYSELLSRGFFEGGYRFAEDKLLSFQNLPDRI